jgi:hypothetical protein
MNDRYVRRAILGLFAGVAALPVVGVSARGGYCEAPRRRSYDGRRCDPGLYRCGRFCVGGDAFCCEEQAYVWCPEEATFRDGECCDAAGSCVPAEPYCPV